MNQPTFVVSRFENRNGSFSWRVDGRLNGVLIRRNFKSQEEACAEKAMLEIKVAQMESGRPNQIATFLTLEQVHDAEAAIRRLQPAGLSLLFSADFTLANYSKPAREMLLADAAREYLAMKERECDQHALSNAHLSGEWVALCRKVGPEGKSQRGGFPRALRRPESSGGRTIDRPPEFMPLGKWPDGR